jgi:2-C-methyl-D-erythritol 4-phosphate cytidylyltransferase / 2-C-methyl-D-erythritol 2,4-cyclodiphosphate synthase
VTSPTADVVVVAAGASSRMGGVDKITAPIGGRPLLAWTLSTFAAVPAVGRVVVVAPATRVTELAEAGWLPPEASVVAGGPRRQESVAAGVLELERAGGAPAEVVLVHDGARPAVGRELVEQVIAAAVAHGAAIPALPVVETVKRLEGDRIAGTVDRDGLALAQTPQGVRLAVLRAAWDRYPPSGPETFTDEASLLEACTIPVHVVPGQLDNLKVTVPADLQRAAAILAPDRPRFGWGEDAHPFGPGSPLLLGGVAFDGAPRLHGHSDGDVVLHAVASALLSAAGLGDLGTMFPADARTPNGVASVTLLETVLARVREAGSSPASLEVTIVGARPRLGGRLAEVRARLAELLGLPVDAVNVQASSGNLVGVEAAGRAISARALVTVELVR